MLRIAKALSLVNRDESQVSACAVPRGLKHAAPVVLLALVMSIAGSASADGIPINLEWQPAAQSVAVGQTVSVGLYAVVEQDSQLLRALDVVFSWDPALLSLTGIEQTGAAPLLMSGFPANDPYGLNESVPPADGDGYYRGWAGLGAPLEISAGVPTLLTTFEFEALSITPTTTLGILESGGDPPLVSRVLGGAEGGTTVTGALGNAVVEIVPEPSSLLLMIGGLLAVHRRR